MKITGYDVQEDDPCLKKSTEVKIVLNKYDGTGAEHTSTFILPVKQQLKR